MSNQVPAAFNALVSEDEDDEVPQQWVQFVEGSALGNAS